MNPRVAIFPEAATFAIFVAMVGNWWRHGDPTRGRPARGGALSERLRYIVTTVIGGYVALLAIVLIFHDLIARQRGAIRSAAVGGGFLALVAAVVFGALSWTSARRRRHT